MIPTLRRFKVMFVDDYRSGPDLRYVEVKPDPSNLDHPPSTDENEDESYDDDWDDAEFMVPDDRCHVFHFQFDADSRLLKSFETWAEAYLYAQQQYTLATGDFPFTFNGEEGKNMFLPSPEAYLKGSAGYHPEGSRVPISVEGMTTTIEPDINDDLGYLFIIHQSKTCVYSLNPYAVW
jgi:hypothetical protein